MPAPARVWIGAGIHQCGNCAGMTITRRSVVKQRRRALLRLRIGAGFQQHFDNGWMHVRRRLVQDAPTVCIPFPQIADGVQGCRGHMPIQLVRGPEQRRFSEFIPGIDVGAAIQQRSSHSPVAVPHRQMQRRSAIVVTGMHVGSGIHKRFDHFQFQDIWRVERKNTAVTSGGLVQCCFTGRVPEIGVSARIQQRSSHLELVFGHCQMQWSSAAIVARVRVGAGFQERKRKNRPEVFAARHRVMQGGVAEVVPRVQLGAGIQQRTHRS